MAEMNLPNIIETGGGFGGMGAAIEVPGCDSEFMGRVKAVLDSIPETWTAYPHTEGGCDGIIDMEYGEFTKADDAESREHELIHLAAACLHMWRCMHD